ncbi:bifunctional DNA primase/polymerase [Micromonospora maritima]|uniref:bifunctional DNA primase/polymerase n=1 Tax=Micromonospora maritima TaxID=986711 RepID=UPI001C2D8616|nr:bifunctional DNA primase/polymerase [Micromonospora maritima]
MNTQNHPPIEQQLDQALRTLDLDTFHRLGEQADRDDAAREARLNAPEALANAARWYASQGIPVFPLMPGEKKPFPGSRGFKDATTNAEQVRRWWTAHPQANIGIPTGGLFDVIDIDGEQGAISYRELRDTDVIPRIYGKATTGRPCSRHLYIAATGDGNSAGVWPGIDFRGKGGYVVAPPSRTERRYDWEQPLDLAGLKAAAQ